MESGRCQGEVVVSGATHPCQAEHGPAAGPLFRVATTPPTRHRQEHPNVNHSYYAIQPNEQHITAVFLATISASWELIWP